ncbi:mRNA decay activator protein ZFP36L1 [Pogona vitticeps]
MPSGFLTSFPELEHDALCQTFLSLRANEDAHREAEIPPGFQRSFSACPLTLSASRREGSERPSEEALALHAVSDRNSPAWPLQAQWSRDPEEPPSASSPQAQALFRLDRSLSALEGGRQGEARAVSSRYKTELCRTFEESGTCKYGAKCQFAHGSEELRGLSRHPKYKTEPCRTFHTSGFCPYGARCHFIHNDEERRPLPRSAQRASHSLGSGGFAAGPLAAASPPPPAPLSPRLLQIFFPGDVLNPQAPPSGSLSTPRSSRTPLVTPGPFAFPSLSALQKSHSADSLSDQEDSGSSVGSSGSESPGVGPPGRRLPIFSQLSVSDD